jgi:putative transcriptional regulator
MARTLSKAARDALAATDWGKFDAMTDRDIARQIASNADAAPDMAPEIDVRAIRRAAGMTQVEFAAAYHFSIRPIQEWERGAKKPSGPGTNLVARHQGRPRRDCARRSPRHREARSTWTSMTWPESDRNRDVDSDPESFGIFAARLLGGCCGQCVNIWWTMR